MRMASIREFRSGMSGLTRKGGMTIVTNHGKMVGCYLPFSATADVPVEFKREFVSALGRRIASQLAAKSIKERDILRDFDQFKKSRGR